MSESTVINLSSYPKATSTNGKKTLSELFTVAEAKAAFPDTFRAYAFYKWTETQIMGLAMFNAMWTDALWRGTVDQSQTGGMFISRNIIEAPPGAWWINDYLHYSFGTYRFPNSGTGNAEWSGNGGGCEILHWVDNWKGANTNRTGERVLFGAVHGGSDSLFAYSEGTAFEGGFRMHGGCGNFRDLAKPRVVGFEAWDFGEASGFERIFTHYCDCGKRIARGTPYNATHTVSSFSNTECGIELMGVGNARFSMISTDDNPRSIQTKAGYGRPDTSNVKVDVIKSEWAVTSKNLGRTWKPQAISLSGKFKWKIDLITHASGAWGNALFILSPEASIGPSALVVDIIDVFANAGTEILVHDASNGIAWKFDPHIVSFKWTNANGISELQSWPFQAEKISAPHKNQLGYFESNPTTGLNSGTFNRTSGTPTWNDSTGNGGSVVTPPIDPNPTSPKIDSFTSNVSSISTGESITLTWQTTNATSVSISGVGTVALDGSQVVTPSASTTYTLTATNNGISVTSNITINVTTPTQSTIGFASTFSGSGPNLVATKGTTISPAISWSNGQFTSGKIKTNSNTSYPWSRGTAAKVVLYGVTFLNAPSPGLWPRITAEHVINPEGMILHGNTPTGITIQKGVKYVKLELPCLEGGKLTTAVGGGLSTGSTVDMTIESMEIYI